MKKKRNWNLILGLSVTLFFFITAVAGQFFTPYPPTQMDALHVNMAPCFAHPMGTDNFGRDILSRVMSGSGNTFFVAVCTVLLGGVIGTVAGALTGYYGGVADHMLMRVSDMILSFPSVLLALIFISLLGPGKYNIIMALGILFIPVFARMVRSEVIRCRELDFVKSAKVMGVGDMRIVFVHILPNAFVSIMTTATIAFNNAVLSEAGMSYLGLGVQPPETSLGRMLSEAQSFLFAAPWYAIFPGIVIILIILGFSMIGEGLRELQK